VLRIKYTIPDYFVIATAYISGLKEFTKIDIYSDRTIKAMYNEPGSIRNKYLNRGICKNSSNKKNLPCNKITEKLSLNCSGV
jgi:hypothetical protein